MKIIVLLLLASPLYAQLTQVGAAPNLTHNSTLPATCTVGDYYFKTGVTAGQNLYGCTATNTWTLQSGGATATIREIPLSFDGGGSPLAGTVTRCRTVNYSGTIQEVEIVSDVSGSATVDVRTVAYSGYTGPGSATSITASATPSLSSALKFDDSTLTGWTTALAAKTVVCGVLSSPSTVSWIAVTIKVAVN